MRRLMAFVRLGRPQFLVGGFVLYGLGGALAVAGGAAFDPWRYGWGQLVVTATQLMTHYANDYFDLEADRANKTPTKWSGGSRVLPGGEVHERGALIAAIVLAVIGGVLAVIIAATVGATLGAPVGSRALATLAVIFVLAWGYSAPPLRLCARGLGELDTAIVVTVLGPFVGFQMRAPDLRGAGLLAMSIAPLALL